MLDRHDAFLLAGLAVPGAGHVGSVYGHAKVMLVDDAWMTGSREAAHPAMRVPSA